MAVIEKVEQNVVDGNNVETTYYDNGDIRTVAKDAQDHEILNKLVNYEGEIRKSVERTYYDNGQQATEIEIYGVDYIDGVRGNVNTTKWREDGQEIFYQETNKNNEVIKERVYEFFENGNVKKCEHKYDGKITALDEYYEHGQLKLHETYGEDAKKTKYYPNGQLAYKDTGFYKGEEGSFVKYYDNGVIEHEVRYTRVKSWGGYVRRLGYEKKNQKDGTPIYSFSGNYGYDEEEIERRYNDKGILTYETKEIGGGWGRETRRFFDNGKLKSIEANCDNRGGGGHWVFDYSAKFDEQGRVTRYRNRGTTITYTYDGNKTIEKIEGDFAEKVPNKISGNYVEWLFPEDRYIGREVGSGVKIDEYDGNKLLKRKVNGLTTEFEYDGDKLVTSTTTNDEGEITAERIVEYYDNGNMRSDKDYSVTEKGKELIKDDLYHENGNLAQHVIKSEGKYHVEVYNTDGKLTYYRVEGVTSDYAMKEYDASGEKLQRSIETLKDGKMKFTEYGEAETVETIKNTEGEVIRETVITYHDNEHKKIATSKTTSPKNLAELTIAYNEAGKEIFKQRVGAFGRLVELYEAYPNGHKKHHITTNADGSQEEKRWNENGVETFYEIKDIKGHASNQTFYPSGRVQMESIDECMIIYWDTEKNNVKERRDTKGDVIYEEYKNGQPKFEKHADGSSTEWYDSGEILCQADKKGNKVFFYKDGEERLTVQANGDKKVEYGDKQFLLIAGRHCYRCGEGLDPRGEKQAARIGKFIAYASQGKIAGLPKIVLPEVCSFTENLRCVQTSRIVVQNINETLHTDINCERVASRWNNNECKHHAKSELSIHSLGGWHDTADSEMGSIAFSVVGRDGFVVDRVVFNVEEIAKQIERIESKEKSLEQQITNKINELKDKTHSEDLSGIPHAKMQILREVVKENVSSEKGVVNPKRSTSDKKIIKTALDKVTKNTRS